jgi:hypothetical protein
MKILGNIKEKSWISESGSDISNKEKNSIQVVVLSSNESQQFSEKTSFGFFIIKDGKFYKSSFFPKDGSWYLGEDIVETVPISVSSGSTLEVYLYFRDGDVFFEDTLSLNIEKEIDIFDSDPPNAKLLAKKDHRLDNFKESKAQMNRQNSLPSIDKI